MADTKKNDPLSIHYGSSQPGEGVLLTPAQEAALGPQAKPETVKMEVLRDGSYAGESRKVGDSIDVDADHVEALTLSGFAARADRAQLAEQAKADDQARRDALAARRGRRTTAVTPMSTTDAGGATTNTTNQQPEANRGDTVNPTAPNAAPNAPGGASTEPR